MKIVLNILLLFTLVLPFSCEEDQPVTKTITETSFDIGNTNYLSDSTIVYQTDFGQLLKIIGENFELYFVLSDTENKIFNITDTLFSIDKGKVRCLYKMNDEYKFSKSGSVEFELSKKSGTFEINMGDLYLKNGKILVDTIINMPIVDFNSLTETDIQGWPTNDGDVNDWGIRTDWTVEERFVFNLKTQTTLSNTFSLIEYPNPLAYSIIIQLYIPLTAKADLFLVNENFEIEQKFERVQQGNVQLLLNNAAYTGNFYRLYYKIYSDSEQFYGSGDLKVQD